MRRDKLLEEQLVRLDALYEYAVMEEALQPICENYAQRPGKVTINVWKPWWKRLIFWQ